jgi:hypothetical protein
VSGLHQQTQLRWDAIKMERSVAAAGGAPVVTVRVSGGGMDLTMPDQTGCDSVDLSLITTALVGGGAHPWLHNE